VSYASPRLHPLVALVALIVVQIPQNPAAAITAEELMAAMGLPADDCSFLGSSGLPAQVDAVDQLGVLTPRQGDEMAVFASGHASSLASCVDDELYLWGDEGGLMLYDLIEVRFRCHVPDGASSLSFDLQFLTREYPVHLGAPAADAMRVELASLAYDGDIVLDPDGEPIDVNSQLLTVTNQVALEGTGFDCGAYGAATGWLRTIAPVVPDETIELTWTLYDVGDGTLDSAVLVEGFAFGDAELDQPTTGVPVELTYVTAKAGALGGGETVTLHGANFTGDTRVSVGGQAATATPRDSARLDVVIPPGTGPGLVDISAEQWGFCSTLSGAYAYQPELAISRAPPTLVELLPDHGAVAGGEVIAVIGSDLDEGGTVYFADEETDVDWIDAGRLQVRTPAMEAGPVEVVVCNPDGQCADPTYLFVFE
jgi:hypothetical protein